MAGCSLATVPSYYVATQAHRYNSVAQYRKEIVGSRVGIVLGYNSTALQEFCEFPVENCAPAP